MTNFKTKTAKLNEPDNLDTVTRLLSIPIFNSKII